MASIAGDAPSMGPLRGQIVVRGAGRVRDGIERWLEAEREQIALWLPVALGGGIATWFLLPDPLYWTAAMLAAAAAGLFALAGQGGGRLLRMLGIGGLVFALGLAVIWWRAERVAAPILSRTAIATFDARVEAVEPLAARGLVRLTLVPVAVAPDDRGRRIALPPRLRVNLAEADVPAGIGEGATIRLRARLMPPPGAAVPGAYDFAKVAWFAGIGATGRGFAPVAVLVPAHHGWGLRAELTRHITGSIAGSGGGIAAALVTGDVGAIEEPDADAMRRAGLAHLLSVSGLHITAAVAATMLVVMRLLALSPWLALHARLPLIAAVAGAGAAIGYTLLTGSQVPTIRSCIAALLVLAAMALGRQPVTLRMLAAGASILLLVWPEALAGPSFQLSFAAIAAIVALHDHPRIAAFAAPQEEAWWRRTARGVAMLLLTGVVVEAALMPIAVYHFHKAGLYGAVANIVAIPLTTFVVMPLEALALVADVGGLGAPFWWLTARTLDVLLLLAHAVAKAPGSTAALPAMPAAAYALMVFGGVWIALWRTRWRRLGLVPLIAGAGWAIATPAPDLLVTNDGRHIAVRVPAGLAMLRDRAGDYTRATLSENGGSLDEPLLLADQPSARCNRDLCLVGTGAGERTRHILATRSAYLVPVRDLAAACARADVVVTDRRLPRSCRPRWLRLDRATLAHTGGVAVTLSTGRIETTRTPGDAHPWVVAAGGATAGADRRRTHWRGVARPEAAHRVTPSDH